MTQRNQLCHKTDASIKGLGACLLQCGHPVYFGSKALTVSQKGYVAIELEALAVLWAMEKFHHFLYATKFILETDQKPLENNIGKESECCNTTSTKDTDQKHLPMTSLSNTCQVNTQPIGRLSFKTWMSSRQNQTPKAEGASLDYSSQCNK